MQTQTMKTIINFNSEKFKLIKIIRRNEEKLIIKLCTFYKIFKIKLKTHKEKNEIKLINTNGNKIIYI